MLEEENKKFILASASPRRKEVMELLGLNFTVMEPRGLKEVELRKPDETVIENSIKKAENIFNNLKARNSYIIISFDTIVYMDNKYFGKPKDLLEAKQFIKSFSARGHDVVSGVCVFDAKTKRYYTDFEKTRVEFKKLSEKQIENYLKKEYVFDKAGGYNIGGFGSVLVRKIDGCFYNVIGVPLTKLVSLLEKVNYKIL